MADDIYSCASGGTIRAGISTPPSIAGSVWTPRRDGRGDVLLSDWRGLSLLAWVEAAGVILNDVIETPHYLNSSGSDGAHAIVDAWCGMAYDYVNQCGYIDGGGHGDSSACENGIYKLDFAQLTFSRVKNRAPLSQLQTWNTVTHGLDAIDHFNAFNSPLLNGEPSSCHTYHSLLWVPPSVLGNASGGIFYGGQAKSVFDLDARIWKTLHWFNPDHDATDWSDSAAVIDGSRIYGPRSYWYHYRYDLTATEATDWSSTSYGNFSAAHANSSVMCTAASALWGWLRERREHFGFGASGFRTRVRYGQAIDANVTTWTSYSDTITLASGDGSHADFSTANLATGALLGAAGVAYDHATETIYVQANSAGGQLYTITGLSGNTWTTTKIAGTGALRTNVNGTYGRLRLATLGGKKILVRISSTTAPVQVMRLN